MVEITRRRTADEIERDLLERIEKETNPKILKHFAGLTIFFLKLVYQHTKAGNQLTPARLQPFVDKVDEVLNG